MFWGGTDSAKIALRRPLTAALAAASLVAGPAALADAVTDWNAFADTLALGPPPVRARATAIMHVAMHDALNSVQPRYESYADVPRARRGASAEAAARQAAASALKGAAPSVAAAVDAFHGAWLVGCTSQQCLDGLAAGDAAANAILLLRNGDGSATPHLPYTLPPALGVYQPTPVTPARRQEHNRGPWFRR